MKTEWLTILFKKLISLIGFYFIINSLLAQNPDANRTNHWFFGNGAGIDFSSGIAIADTNGQLHTYEGCAYGSSSHAATIIPNPGNEDQYFIITNDCQENLGSFGLRFSIVDLSLNAGYGDIDSAKKILCFLHQAPKGLPLLTNVI
ncbi:MAG: hypothetical protein LH473_12620 [Chitinophagales bacterium]|nr:hypothetical protein [Chitinophagales bacterium]